MKTFVLLAGLSLMALLFTGCLGGEQPTAAPTIAPTIAPSANPSTPPLPPSEIDAAGKDADAALAQMGELETLADSLGQDDINESDAALLG